MRKLIVLFSFMLIGISAFSQVQYYKATTFAQKTNSGYGWTDWTDWEYSGIIITIDIANDIISTYGSSPQAYKVISISDIYEDNSGGTQIKFTCIDLKDDIKCTIRLRVESNGNSQIYIDYSNIMLVFNVKRQ